jgi:EAL domain-containing protein (putative c-di-GMP-specific phosphodiesterase class I)
VLHEPFEIEGYHDTPITISASIGIAVGDRSSAGELLRDADIALYRAKAGGKNRFVVFASEMRDAVTDRTKLDMDLRGALERGEFFLVFQPIFELSRGLVTGAEALLRWRHPVRGIVEPDVFVPILEESGRIVEVGRWVLTEACRQAGLWRADGHRIDIAVNFSVRQLETSQFIEDIRIALLESGIDPASLILEITETAIMRDAEATAERLRAVKELGIRIAVDDFGTGYSSLAYLSQFPIDSLKIDRSFIAAIGQSSEGPALTRMLVQLGKALGLETLAEGIEDEQQYVQLQDEECDRGQGFLMARPLEADALRAFLDLHADELVSLAPPRPDAS